MAQKIFSNPIKVSEGKKYLERHLDIKKEMIDSRAYKDLPQACGQHFLGSKFNDLNLSFEDISSEFSFVFDSDSIKKIYESIIAYKAFYGDEKNDFGLAVTLGAWTEKQASGASKDPVPHKQTVMISVAQIIFSDDEENPIEGFKIKPIDPKAAAVGTKDDDDLGFETPLKPPPNGGTGTKSAADVAKKFFDEKINGGGVHFYPTPGVTS